VTRFLPALVVLTWAPAVAAQEARFHATAGAAHAVGGTQQREFGPGGGGAASVELPIGRVLGVQASGGALVLSQGAAPVESGVARKETGAAFLGTVGVRLRPLGAHGVAGPWIDANGGLAQTGDSGRVAVDAHLGWDFRVSDRSRWDVGPFVGYTQIFQPDGGLRGDDARIAWAGIQIGLGAAERPRTAPPPDREVKEPPVADRDGVAEAFDVCPPADGSGAAPDGCPVPEVTLEGDRLVIDDVILFDFDSPRIKLRSHAVVRRVAEFINEHPELLEVSIEGHADARGSDEYNRKLSVDRAASTRALLVGFGVDEARLRVIGHGKSRLRVPTSRPEAKNRRVEFIVTGDVRAALPPAEPQQPQPSPRVASGKRGRP